MKACIVALREHPYINASIDEEKEEIEGQLRFIYVMRSFMALIEGERNEKIALKQ